MFTILTYLILYPNQIPLPLPRAGSRLNKGALKGPSSLGAAQRAHEADKTPLRSDNCCIILAQLVRIRIFIAVARLDALVFIPPHCCIVTPGRAGWRADWLIAP